MTPYEQLTDRHPLVPPTGLGQRFPHQRIFVVAALFALVVTLGAVSARPIYRLLKLQRARQLLAQSDLPISSIGYNCGYMSNASFTRAFARRFGMAPTKMRGREVTA